MYITCSSWRLSSEMQYRYNPSSTTSSPPSRLRVSPERCPQVRHQLAIVMLQPLPSPRCRLWAHDNTELSEPAVMTLCTISSASLTGHHHHEPRGQDCYAAPENTRRQFRRIRPSQSAGGTHCKTTDVLMRAVPRREVHTNWRLRTCAQMTLRRHCVQPVTPLNTERTCTDMPGESASAFSA